MGSSFSTVTVPATHTKVVIRNMAIALFTLETGAKSGELCGEEGDTNDIRGGARLDVQPTRWVRRRKKNFLPVLDDRMHNYKRVKRLRKLQNLLGSYSDLVVEEARFHEIALSCEVT